MLSRRRFAGALGGALALPSLTPGLLTPAAAQDFPDAPVAINAGVDRQDRLTIPVRIGQAGPYAFVVDTGADRSVIASNVAEALALPPGRPVLLHGITGAQLTQTVKAPPLTLGGVTLKAQELPVLDRARLGVDGLLGVDVLQRRRLIMDFGERRLEIQAAGQRLETVPSARSALVEARDSFGKLTVIDARANGVLATAFVDSGGGVTIVNQVLAEAVRRRGQWREAAPIVTISGVTDHVAQGELRLLDRLLLGSLRFNGVPVVVTDLHLFKQWGLDKRPAVLLGVNVLRLFSRVELDYSRRRMLFRAGQEAPSMFA